MSGVWCVCSDSSPNTNNTLAHRHKHPPKKNQTITKKQHVVDDMEDIRRRRLGALAPDPVLGEPEPDVVRVWTSLPTREMLEAAAASTVQPPPPDKHAAARAERAVARGLAGGGAVAGGGLFGNPHDAGADADPEAGGVTQLSHHHHQEMDPKLLYDYRCRVLHMAKQQYAETYDAHMLTTPQMRALQAVTDAALDSAAVALCDWALLAPQCRLRGWPRALRALGAHRVLGAGAVAAGAYTQALDNLQTLVAFVRAHRHAQAVLQEHIRVRSAAF